jgi:hypothetical protein
VAYSENSNVPASVEPQAPILPLKERIPARQEPQVPQVPRPRVQPPRLNKGSRMAAVLESMELDDDATTSNLHRKRSRQITDNDQHEELAHVPQHAPVNPMAPPPGKRQKKRGATPPSLTMPLAMALHPPMPVQIRSKPSGPEPAPAASQADAPATTKAATKAASQAAAKAASQADAPAATKAASQAAAKAASQAAAKAASQAAAKAASQAAAKAASQAAAKAASQAAAKAASQAAAKAASQSAAKAAASTHTYARSVPTHTHAPTRLAVPNPAQTAASISRSSPYPPQISDNEVDLRDEFNFPGKRRLMNHSDDYLSENEDYEYPPIQSQCPDDELPS